VALNIGSLVAFLELDDRNFTRKADQAERKLDALKLHLEALSKSDPKIRVQVDAETAKIDALKLKIDELKAKAAKGIDVRVDMVQAMVELDAIQAKVRSLHGKEIRVDVDTKAATANVSALGTAIAVLAPTIGPVTASVGGLAAALSGPFAAAAGGLGLWVALAKQAVKGTEEQNKKLVAAEKKVDNAKTAKAKAKAVEEYNRLYKRLAETQIKFLDGQKKLKDAFGGLVNSKAVFGPLIQGMSLLTQVLPKLKPLLDSVAQSLSITLTGLSRWVASGGFDKFVTGFAALSGPAIRGGLATLGNLAKGAAGIAKAFAPMGMDMFAGIERASARFAAWGNGSTGLAQFVTYVQTELPKVLHTLGDLGTAVVHFATAAAPAGSVILNVLSMVARGISAIPTPVLMPLASGLIAVNLALKAIAVTTKAGNALGFEGIGAGLANVKRNVVGVVGGLTLIAGSLMSSSDAIQTWGTAAGAAIAGFSVGGPIGAVIGGVAGAIGGTLFKALHKSNKEFEDARRGAEMYAYSLRGVAGAITDETRAQALKDIGNKNLKTAQGLGFSVRDITSAGLGDAAAKAKLLAAIAKEKKSLAEGLSQAQTAAGGELVDTSAYDKAIAKLDALTQAIGGSNRGLRDQREQLWNARKASDAYAAMLGKLSKPVRTKIEAMNVAPTVGQIVDLQRRYHMTPPQIRTLLQLAGVKPTRDAINDIIARANQVPKKVQVTFQALGLGAFVQAANIAVAAASKVPGKRASGKHARGGFIAGPGSATSDSIPAMLSNGEFVVNAAATKRHMPLLMAVNSQKFASGGLAANRNYDQRLLAQYAAMLAATNGRITAARDFGASFGSNVFSQGFTGNSVMTAPYQVGGSMVTRSAGSAGILDEMFAFQRDQLAQAKTLDSDVARLRKMGLSKSLIAQMQAAGPAGIAEIHALAGGTREQVQEFNKLSAKTDAYLSDAGAYATAGTSMSGLQKDAKTKHMIVSGIQEAMKHGVKVTVVNGHLRTAG